MQLLEVQWLAMLCWLSQSASCYRILGFHPTPGKSQQNIFAPILYSLAQRGHTVVYLTPVQPEFSHPNLDVRLIPQYKERFQAEVGLETLNTGPVFLMPHKMYTATQAMAPFMYGSKAAQDIIHSEDEHFDAVTMESAFFQEPVSALLHKFSCPGIEISTLSDFSWLNEISGLPDNPAYQMDFKSPYSDQMMSFWERLYNTYITWSSLIVNYFHLQRQEEIMNEYFNYTGWEGRPPLSKLLFNRSLVLVNQDVVLGYPVPTAPHVKLIGGINILPNKPLPKELQDWMDNAKNGVILFSLGSNLKTSEIMSTPFGDAFFSLFRELPQRVVMKWETEEVPQGMPPNILLYRWIPQQDVLAHPKCRLFISHGGFLSVTETVHHGVPILGIPFFGDQPRNMHQAVSTGFGLELNHDNITYDSVDWAVRELLNNPRYRSEARRRSSMLRDRIHTAQEEAVHWIEHAIKYPNLLTPRSAFMPLYQIYLLDIKAFLLLLLYLFYKIMKYSVIMMRNGISPKKKQKMQ